VSHVVRCGGWRVCDAEDEDGVMALSGGKEVEVVAAKVPLPDGADGFTGAGRSSTLCFGLRGEG
jgi:hypothetical protein